jgi:FMN phosphatase YigB (HAD superfamily)
MKYVALDIGNVLCHVDFNGFLNDLSAELNVNLEDAMYFLNRSQKKHDLGITIMRDELHDHFHIKSPVIIDRLLHSWSKSIKPDLRVLDMYNTMTEKHGLKVALLSNIGIEHAKQAEEILAHGGFFEGAIKHFSCNVGARKPTSLYYQSFLMEYPEFHGCVYVDDVLENLETGKRYGFRSYHFDLSKMDTSRELPEIEKMILEVAEVQEKNPRWH